MKNVLKTVNEAGEEIVIEIVFSFRIDEFDKSYVV